MKFFMVFLDALCLPNFQFINDESWAFLKPQNNNFRLNNIRTNTNPANVTHTLSLQPKKYWSQVGPGDPGGQLQKPTIKCDSGFTTSSYIVADTGAGIKGPRAFQIQDKTMQKNKGTRNSHSDDFLTLPKWEFYN